jgi:hypothetical protein
MEIAAGDFDGDGRTHLFITTGTAGGAGPGSGKGMRSDPVSAAGRGRDGVMDSGPIDLPAGTAPLFGAQGGSVLRMFYTGHLTDPGPNLASKREFVSQFWGGVPVAF